ncbi:protein spire homolog 1-like [Oncorhynchus keta]|uniref:protein spire homolog 1-like n=1 Tax=Oncorhynchus keta TaxID=8018 RepID=UPI00227B8CEC|nr:protein spire homolog 1-like [Oncorhynchus keta]
MEYQLVAWSRALGVRVEVRGLGLGLGLGPTLGLGLGPGQGQGQGLGQAGLGPGQLCFSCRTKRFSFFNRSYTCQFCKRPVCSQCCKKKSLPSKPYANLSISSLGSTTTILPREEAGGTSALDTPEKPSSSQRLRRTVSRLSKRKIERSSDELDLPKELTEDWCTMEVCISCKMFISEIISSSKRSLATKQAHLKRKTQSFHISSANTNYCRPSVRNVKEV